ncbi:hypothetical protein [Parvicella tangerina]|uniref:Uncharacterized protein n=1 Tax=Parvicella tangerina TaxID=2829795 RepID=A0A916JQA6_9FLAO|nr:hypothetical protein [Parvicella tangerina]CAG5086153.1 hypothetical protein CRYO30217_03026 [Parvicella tangerina]
MTTPSKPRIVKDYEKLEPSIIEQIKLEYPYGFYQHLVSYVDREGKKRMALPFETEEKYYLVRMSIQEAKDIIEEDDDYDDDGTLKEDILQDYAEKYDDDIDEDEEEED